VNYTSARVRGAELRRNVPWTPLVTEIVPHDLGAGVYTLTVTWHCTDTAQEKKDQPADLEQTTTFELTK
jgi:hypothetical protein